MPRPRIVVDKEELLKWMSANVPLEYAAKQLNCSRSTLKKRCRELGLPNWPYYKNQTSDPSVGNNVSSSTEPACTVVQSLPDSLNMQQCNTCPSINVAKPMTLPMEDVHSSSLPNSPSHFPPHRNNTGAQINPKILFTVNIPFCKRDS
ncbi:hypothetical protein GEMRC1_008344 [Eukaryota sp. GEM-RC1]